MEPEIQEISAEDAKRLLDQDEATFVDVRDPGSYSAAHVPGALNLLDSTVEAFVTGTPKDRTLVVYCFHGHSSLGGAAYFMDQGFKTVFSMTGGFESWRGTYPQEPPRPG